MELLQLFHLQLLEFLLCYTTHQPKSRDQKHNHHQQMHYLVSSDAFSWTSHKAVQNAAKKPVGCWDSVTVKKMETLDQFLQGNNGQVSEQLVNGWDQCTCSLFARHIKVTSHCFCFWLMFQAYLELRNLFICLFHPESILFSSSWLLPV